MYFFRESISGQMSLSILILQSRIPSEVLIVQLFLFSVMLTVFLLLSILSPLDFSNLIVYNRTYGRVSPPRLCLFFRLALFRFTKGYCYFDACYNVTFFNSLSNLKQGFFYFFCFLHFSHLLTCIIIAYYFQYVNTFLLIFLLIFNFGTDHKTQITSGAISVPEVILCQKRIDF